MHQPSIVLWTAYVALVALGLFAKRSKAYDAAVVAFMGTLALLNTDAADLHMVYLPVYAHPELYEGSVEYGWLALCRLGAGLGLSYNGFACLLTVACMLLVVLFARKATPNESFYLSLFLVYPGLMSLVQFRQFVASTVGILAVLVLSKGRRRDWVGFFALIILAFCLHRSSLVFALCALLPLYRALGGRGRCLMVVLCAAAVAFATANARLVGGFLFGEFRTSAYLGAATGGASLLGGLRNVAYILLMCLLVPYCARAVVDDGQGPARTRLVEMAAFLNVFMVALVPFALMTNDFMRFERQAFMLALAVFAAMPYLRHRHALLSTKAVLLVVCLLFCYSFVVKGTFDPVIGSLLSYDCIPAFFAAAS